MVKCRDCEYCEPHLLNNTPFKFHVCELVDEDGYYRIVDPEVMRSCDKFKEEKG